MPFPHLIFSFLRASGCWKPKSTSVERCGSGFEGLGLQGRQGRVKSGRGQGKVSFCPSPIQLFQVLCKSAWTLKITHTPRSRKLIPKVGLLYSILWSPQALWPPPVEVPDSPNKARTTLQTTYGAHQACQACPCSVGAKDERRLA